MHVQEEVVQGKGGAGMSTGLQFEEEARVLDVGSLSVGRVIRAGAPRFLTTERLFGTVSAT